MRIRRPRPRARLVFVVCCPGFMMVMAVSLIAVAGVILAYAKESAPQSSEPGSEYAGSAACAQCHQEIYKQFSKTSMGHSMSLVTPTVLKTIHAPASVRDKNSNASIEVEVRDGKLFQTQYEKGGDGREIYRDSHQLDWIIGAGENGFGGLLKQDDYLFQAPLSFYSKTQSWALSPGYEFGNYGFNRPILPACIFCHSGRPSAIPEGNGRFGSPPFPELAIACENCHGPGLSHVVANQMGSESYAGHDPTIVNPAHLSAALSDNICMSCHQTGDVRVLKPGKEFKDFRPGTPLDNTLSILMVPPKRESPPQSDLLEHYYSMTLSKCYRASGRKLGCITCHDPHVEPSREEAPGYFRNRCLTCHSEKSCTLALDVRQHQQPPDDCGGCHMPKRDVQEISHSSITNHRILSRPDEAFPEEAFHQTTAGLPDLIHLNPAPGQKDTTPPPLVLLQAYGELAERHPEYVKRYLEVLDQLERTDPDNPLVLAAIGTRESQSGKYEEAITHLRHALETGPPKTFLYTELANALVKLDRPAEAAVVLRKAIALDPFNSELQRMLIVRLIDLKEYASARTALENYVERFPEDSFMRQMLARARAAGPAK